MSTIYDVVRSAGVSAKTVSRVLNGDGPVGAATREAIARAIATLGYVPSNAARMMRSSKSGLVGLITGAISTVKESTPAVGLPDLFIVQGIQQVMAQFGMTVMIGDTGGQKEAVPHLMDTFLSHRVEGLIYVAEFHQPISLPKRTGRRLWFWRIAMTIWARLRCCRMTNVARPNWWRASCTPGIAGSPI